jgi:hypothetical protein
MMFSSMMYMYCEMTGDVYSYPCRYCTRCEAMIDTDRVSEQIFRPSVFQTHFRSWLLSVHDLLPQTSRLIDTILLNLYS